MEEVFWNKIKDNNKEGLKDLYDSQFEALYTFGSYIHKDKDQVLDAIHDLFVRIWDKRGTITIPNNTKNYLFTALRNELLQKSQRSSKIILSEKIEDQEEEGSFFDLGEEDDIKKRKVKKAMDSLTEKNREVIYLKYKDNLTNEEIAEILEINYQSVRNLLHRAIKQLKKNIPNVSTILLLIYL